MTARRRYPPDREIERLAALADRLGKGIVVRPGGVEFVDKSKMLPANSPGGEEDAATALDEFEQSYFATGRASNDRS